MSSAFRPGDAWADTPLPRGDTIASLVLADDDARFRAYLRTLLTLDPLVEIVGEAESGADALELVAALNPDLLLVDLAMPELNGIETTRRALSSRPGLRVIVITMHNDRRMSDGALAAGCRGYLLKDRLNEELADALAAVEGGQIFVSNGVAVARQSPPLRGRQSGPEPGRA